MIQGAKVEASKYNNLIPYLGTPLHNDVRNGDRVHIDPGWSNSNSTRSVTRSIFDKAPLAYVPETTSEFELKLGIMHYNSRTHITPRAMMSILFGKRGPACTSLAKR